MIEAQRIIVDKNLDSSFAHVHFGQGMSVRRKPLAKALAEQVEYFHEATESFTLDG
jgi:hypothetical protein